MKSGIDLILFFIFSFALNLLFAHSSLYERNIENEFPDETFIYFSNEIVSTDGNAKVGGWPLYWLVNKVDSNLAKEEKLSIFDDVTRNKAFFFNWFYCFFLLYSVAGMIRILTKFFLNQKMTKKDIRVNNLLYCGFVAFFITFFSSYFYIYERDVEGYFPHDKSLSYYHSKETKNNLLVGGWPFYHVVDNPKRSFTGKLSLIENDYANSFLFFSNWFLTFLVLLGMVNLWIRVKEKILKLAGD